MERVNLSRYAYFAIPAYIRSLYNLPASLTFSDNEESSADGISDMLLRKLWMLLSKGHISPRDLLLQKEVLVSSFLVR